MDPDHERPSGPTPPKQENLYRLGDTLKTHHDFVGVVDAIYADYWAARNSNVISQGWFDLQEKKPCAKDQVFYSLVDRNGHGAVLIGEAEAELV